MKKQKSILIVEDFPASIRILKMELEKKGFQVHLAEGGFSGLEAAKKIKPDLILLDIMLPDMDGHKVCRMLKMNKSMQHIPVAMLTSRDTDEDAERAREMGADAFILKTTRLPVTLHIIDGLLEKHGKTPEKANRPPEDAPTDQ